MFVLSVCFTHMIYKTVTVQILSTYRSGIKPPKCLPEAPSDAQSAGVSSRLNEMNLNKGHALICIKYLDNKEEVR
jgi:hypothetical protein